MRRATGRICSNEAHRLLKSLPKDHRRQPAGVHISPPLNQVLERAFDEAERFKDEFVSTEHLLLAIAEQQATRPGSFSIAPAPPTTRC